MLEEDSGDDLFEPHRPEESVDEDDPAVLGIDEEVSKVDLMHELDEGVVQFVVGGRGPPPGMELARRGDDGAGRGLSRVANLQSRVGQTETSRMNAIQLFYTPWCRPIRCQ